MNANNFAAYEAGLETTYTHPDDAFKWYRKAAMRSLFKPCVSASVCFVAGYLGKDFPEHDERVK